MELKQFCHKTHKDLSEPFSDGLYTYATDGSIMVRVPRILKITRSCKVGVDSLPFVHDKIPESEWFDITEDVLPVVECDECGTPGRLVVEVCPECEERCYVRFENGYSCYEVECGTCDGIGRVGCIHPCGCRADESDIALYLSTNIGGMRIDSRYKTNDEERSHHS